MTRSASLPAVLLAGAALTVVTVPASALQQPQAGSRDARVRNVVYDPSNVVKVNGVIRASTQVMFADGEEIAHVAIGDSVSWEIAPAGNILFLKPRERHPATNLQVVTTRRDGRKRSYQFELSITEGSLAESYFVVRFSYPEDEAELRRTEASLRRSAAEAGAIDQTFALSDAAGPRNWRYSAQGAAALEPDGVYDDGRETYLRFEGNREIPAVYLVAGDGTESLVPKDVRGELVVIHAIGRELRLRQGSQVTCLFNEAFDAVGVNYGTRTTSPAVARTARRQNRSQGAAR
ncbi:P-type conjugative transfer protein VirB9 [Methylobacterium sp. C25]|uniref:P-type conjugative transfer protein VirB9 n=1 Tax=Methylobacterium sp. C25 TaxID=2721622 RepID=UPI001F487D42|nr:P-type conjugative transfer protein VirB9 [Methylobacterium sp. C25]MCE4226354.1 P-type conjugative transfer protein VirB9 [Methylobacterium sp. C25]